MAGRKKRTTDAPTPTWVSGRCQAKGRPKKNTRAKSPLEMALSQHNGTGVKKRRVHMTDEELELMQGPEDGDGSGGDGNGASGAI